MALSPEQRVLHARLASHHSWANTPNPTERTAPGRRAFMERFEKEVDPEGILPEAERLRRAEHLRKAHFTRLAYKSAIARRRGAKAKKGGADG